MRILDMRKERGDTLVEVLLAIAILGAVITVVNTVMARSLGSGYNSMDRTASVALMDGQASMIRLAHERYTRSLMQGGPIVNPTIWNELRGHAMQIIGLDTVKADGCTGAPNRFYLMPTADVSTGAIEIHKTPAETINTARIGTQPKLGDGIWVEAYYELLPDNRGRNMTFYIKSCTDPIYGDGNGVKRQNKTVLRFYDPRP